LAEKIFQVFVGRQTHAVKDGQGLLKENRGTSVASPKLLEELYKVDPPLVHTNLTARTVHDQRHNLKRKFRELLKTDGKHKRPGCTPAPRSGSTSASKRLGRTCNHAEQAQRNNY